jgi:transglutaminase/protease-like cytokinesis protein 3
MTLSIIPVNQIFGKYDQQTRMGELHRKNPVKTTQGQADRVTISPEALKKRAIDAALVAIQSSSQVSTEAKPTSEDNIEVVSRADKAVQNVSGRPHELVGKKEENLQNQAGGVRDVFLKKAMELKEKAANEKKESYEKEATPF